MFYDSCSNNISSVKKDQKAAALNDCTAKTVIAFARNLGEETVVYLKPIRAGDESILNNFARCLQVVESQADRKMDSIKKEVDKCVSMQLKPRLIMEIHHFYNSKITMTVSGGERAVIEDSFTLLSPFFEDQVTPSGSGVDPVLVLGQTFEQLIRFIAPAAQFDQVMTQRRITEFKRLMRAKVATGKITQMEFTEELVNSSLMDTIIEAQVATEIGNFADNAWLSDTVRARVVSPENMREFFEVNPKGRAIMQAIKREVVKPMLAGVPMNTIMSKVSKQVGIEVNNQIDAIKRELKSIF
jgi:hypothetical protein